MGNLFTENRKSMAAGKVAFATLSGFGFLLFGMEGAAHADPLVALQQTNSNRVVEVWHSSQNDGAVVDAYPSNGSSTQYWWIGDVTTTASGTTYHKFSNYNSTRMMDAYNSTCIVHQYGQGVTSSQHQRQWRFGASFVDGDTFAYHFHNRNGCTDDVYRDRLNSWGADSSGIYTVSVARVYTENPSWIYRWRIYYF